MNGASGPSDIEGKAARVAASEAGAERVSTLRKRAQIRVYSCPLVVENLSLILPLNASTMPVRLGPQQLNLFGIADRSPSPSTRRLFRRALLERRYASSPWSARRHASVFHWVRSTPHRQV